MEFQEIYVASKQSDPIYIGYEAECKAYESEDIAINRLALYLRKFLSNERVLTKILSYILLQVNDDREKKTCIDLCLCNMIRGGWRNIGNKVYIENLCAAISAVNKPEIVLYESHCMVRSYRIRNTQSSLYNDDPRHRSNRRRLI